MNPDKLEKLAADYEAKAQAIRTTMALLAQTNGHAAVQALPAKLKAAARLRQPWATNGRSKLATIMDTITVLWAKAETVQTRGVIEQLQASGVTVSTTSVITAANTLQARKSGKGTAAHWLPPRGWTPAAAAAPAAGSPNGHSAKRQAQVQRITQILASFDRVEPVTTADVHAQMVADGQAPATVVAWLKGLPALVRRGYLKKKGRGYVRTAKPYQP